MAQGHIARFYVENLPEQGLVSLDQERSRHAKALRIRENDPVELFDGASEYQAVFKGWHQGIAQLDILSKSEQKGQSGAQITLATAFPKGKHADFLVQKATEVGAHRIIPLISKRTVVDPGATKLERLLQIAITACEQCGRTTIPAISEPFTVDKILADAGQYDARFIADSSGEPLVQTTKAKNVLVLVGPEGGFTDEELAQAKRAGCIPISLGPTTLRTETAAIVAVAALTTSPHEHPGSLETHRRQDKPSA